jgi:hypothetical protein
MGLDWGIQAKNIRIMERKQLKYVTVLDEFLEEKSVTLQQVESIYRKLQHCTTILPEGQAYLVNLSRDRMQYNGHEHARCHLSRSAQSDLNWWRDQLDRQIPPCPLPYATGVNNPRAFSDASSKVGIAIWIDGWWHAWHLQWGWDSGGRNIAWAKAVSFELLVQVLGENGATGHTLLWGDNQVIVEGWWQGSSNSLPVNSIFKCIHTYQRKYNLTIHSRYVPSASNPTDDPSCGVYGDRS